MATLDASLLFLVSFTLTVLSSIVLSRRIEQLGKWLRLSESPLGIVTALGADAPEISSAITALRSGQHELGLGIVLGSNIFNLAALLGLSALLSGQVRVQRRSLLLNGAIAFAIMAITTVQLYGVLSAVGALSLLAVVMIPYVTAPALPPRLAGRIITSLRFQTQVALTAPMQTKVPISRKRHVARARPIDSALSRHWSALFWAALVWCVPRSFSGQHGRFPPLSWARLSC